MHVSYGEKSRTLTTMSPTKSHTFGTRRTVSLLQCIQRVNHVQLRTEERSTTRPSSPEVESLEAQVGQLQSRLMYMEEEKARLVAAAKGKNEQVQIVNAASVFVIGNPTCCTGYENHAQ